MSRIHIPFRFGKASGLELGEIRTLANQFREMVLEADDPLPGQQRTVHLKNAMRVLGGRLGQLDASLPHDQQLALEVWGPGDFTVYEPRGDIRGTNNLQSFSLLSSYYLHYHQCFDQKWKARDGSPIGMQWARTGDEGAALVGKAGKEAYAFALTVVAPVTAIKKAIEEFGPDKFWLQFSDNLLRRQAIQRAVSLGLIEQPAQSA